ncbi:MAG: hypothetical protein IPO51_14015 [Dehalococcoidia bacterium]|nr:hypothetical protein [Dehalococcoidia bacterium]
MRTVFLVTRHPDVARLARSLSALASPRLQSPRTPRQRRGLGPTADVVVLDLRDIPAAAFNILSANYAENGVILIVILAPEQMDRISADLPVDDFVVLPRRPKNSAAESNGLSGANTGLIARTSSGVARLPWTSRTTGLPSATKRSS